MKLHQMFERRLSEQQPPKDMFETGSAQQIVGWIRDQNEDAQKAIATLNFWIMKQGKKLEPNRAKVMDFAKELLAKEFKDEGKLKESVDEVQLADIMPIVADESEQMTLQAAAKTKLWFDFATALKKVFRTDMLKNAHSDQQRELLQVVSLGAKIALLRTDPAVASSASMLKKKADELETEGYINLYTRMTSVVTEILLYKKH